MEFCYNFAASSSSSLERFRQLTVKPVGYVLCVIISFFFAGVGTILGGITGAMIGQESEWGFLRGATVGAVSGALLSVEVFETFRRLWTDGKGSFLYLIGVLVRLGSGTLVWERFDPMMLNAVQNQMVATEQSFQEVMNIFENGGFQGLPRDIVETIPKVEITTENRLDSCRERIACSVCLQDFQLGEIVRSLPYCHHMFHPTCIDQWLVKHGSCPLCRRDLRFCNDV